MTYTTDNPKQPDNKYCMRTGHTQPTEAKFALQFTFVMQKKGFRARPTTGFLGVYVCDACATQEAADAFKNNDLKALAMSIASSMLARFDWDLTVCIWVPRHGADVFFQKVTDNEQKVAAERQKQLTGQTESEGKYE